MIAQIGLVLACAFVAQGSVVLDNNCYGSGILDGGYAGCGLNGNYAVGLDAAYGNADVSLGCGNLNNGLYNGNDWAINGNWANNGYLNGQDVVLPTLGPRSSCLAPVNLPSVVIPAPSRTIDTPAPLAPAPRVISNTCSCSKLVCKPQIVQRLVRRPSTVRVIRKNWVPVTRSINYRARGLTGPEPCAQSALSYGSSLGSLAYGNSCGAQVAIGSSCGC